MANALSELKASFDRDGYILLRSALDPSEVTHYRSLIQKISGLDDGSFDIDESKRRTWDRADGVTTTREFWPLIFHPRLLEAIRTVVGDDARYTQHSDLHVNHGTPGWHRDSAHRRFGVGPDWDESRASYKIVRVAIYLQPYSDSGSALGIIPGSHRHESFLNRLELRGLAWRNRRRAKRGKQTLAGRFLTLRPRWIETEPGDCLIFDQRVLHSAGPIRGPKYAIFLSYGADNEHSRNHRRYYLYERDDLRYEDYPAELADKLRSGRLYLALTGDAHSLAV